MIQKKIFFPLLKQADEVVVQELKENLVETALEERRHTIRLAIKSHQPLITRDLLSTILSALDSSHDLDNLSWFAKKYAKLIASFVTDVRPQSMFHDVVVNYKKEFTDIILESNWELKTIWKSNRSPRSLLIFSEKSIIDPKTLALHKPAKQEQEVQVGLHQIPQF